MDAILKRSHILILVAIVGGGYVGYYIQYNKESVKEKTIKFINKL